MNENQFKEKVDTVTKAIDELGAALTDEGLFGKLAEMNGPLQNESDEQATKGRTLRESHAQLEPRVQAQARILATEIDRALSEGRDDDVKEKQQEGEKIKINLQDILTQASACEARVRELAEQQGRNYRLVFEEIYPQIREATVGVEIALATLLDKVWADLQRYGQESGLTRGLGISPLVRMGHKIALTPDGKGPERIWFAKLRQWFGA